MNNQINESALKNINQELRVKKLGTNKKIVISVSGIPIFLIVLYALMRIFVFDFFIVSGLGMKPTFERGDWVLLKTYDKNYNRGDIVAFKDPQFNENSFKRIVGLPGEKVKIAGNFVWINNQKLDEYCYLSFDAETLRDTELTLKENEYFVLGDNRKSSIDSRVFGAITKESIIGKYWLSLFNFKNENKLIDKCVFLSQTDLSQTDMQTYKNEEYGFEVNYPGDWNLSSGDINNPSNPGYEILVKNKNNNKESVTISITANYPAIPNSSASAPLSQKIIDVSQKRIDGFEAEEQKFINGWCDALSCTNPFICLWVKYKGYFYTFNFSNSTTITGVYDQILSSFKLLGSDVTRYGTDVVFDKIYRNEEYGFEISYRGDYQTEQPDSNTFILRIPQTQRYLQIQGLSTTPLSDTDYYKAKGVEYVSGKIIIGGKEAVRYYTKHSINQEVIVNYDIILGAKKWLHIEFYGNEQEHLFGPILSTLKFSDLGIENWKTYRNQEYGFEFKYPSNIFAYDQVDYTGGQIPDIAGFGYTAPDQYAPGDLIPVDKMGLARILVWTNISQDLRSWVQTKEPNIKDWIDTEVGNVAALVNYEKDDTSSERESMTTKIYYLMKNNTIIKIMGFSVNNQYSDNWIKDFDKIVATFKFTKSKFCTDPLIPLEIGYDKHPVDPKYGNLNWLGQIFTAYDCGSERLDAIFGVDKGIFSIGLHINLKNNPSQQLINIFNALGFDCADNNSAERCKIWEIKEPIKIDDLMKLKPYYDNFQRDDCVECG